VTLHFTLVFYARGGAEKRPVWLVATRIPLFVLAIWGVLCWL